MSRQSATEGPDSIPASLNASSPSSNAPSDTPGATTAIGALAGGGALQSSPGRRGNLGDRSILLGRDRGIKTVLSSELESVTEVPGEGPGEPEEGEWDGAAGGMVTPRTPRRNSSSRRHRRRRSSSGSSSLHGPIIEQGEGGVGEGAKQEGVNPSTAADVEPEAEGLTLRVRVSAPVICVLLVHDNDSRGSRGQASSPAVVTGDGTRQPAATLEGGAVGTVGAVGRTSDVSSGVEEDGGDRLGASTRNGTRERPEEVDGALVVVEINGLGVEYRDIIGGGGDGVRQTAIESRVVAVADGGGAASPPLAARNNTEHDQPATHHGWCCVTAASFGVKDMHQQAGDAFSYLLSSSPPPIVQTGQGGAGTEDGVLPTKEAPADGLLPTEKSATENSAKITVEFARPGAEKGGAGAKPCSTVVSLAGLWANWNPETVAALSIFAYGMYGNGIRGGGQAEGGGHSSTTPTRQGDNAVAGEPDGQGSADSSTTTTKGRHVDTDRGGGGVSQREAAVAEGTDTRQLGGNLVVEVKRVSLWLNKEVYGRRLLLLEAGESEVGLCFFFVYIRCKR